MFKIGDRVKYIALDKPKATGRIGIVREISNSRDSIGVEFDIHIDGHDLGMHGNSCLYGHGWYIPKHDLLLIEEQMPKTKRMFTNSQKIRLRLKTYWDKNETEYKDFEEFYTEFTEAVLENLEFLVGTFDL